MSKMIFKKYFQPVRPKIKNAQNLLKFGTFHISKIPVSILMSKIIFMKYLSPFRPKLVPKLKVLRIYWNFTHSIFQVCQSGFWCQKWFFEVFTSCQDKLTPRLKLIWNLCLLFQVFQSWLRDLIKVSLNNYYMLCQNWSRSL